MPTHETTAPDQQPSRQRAAKGWARQLELAQQSWQRCEVKSSNSVHGVDAFSQPPAQLLRRLPRDAEGAYAELMRACSSLAFAQAQLREHRGCLHWVAAKGREYLYLRRDGAFVSLGARSAETERRYEEFLRRRAELKSEVKSTQIGLLPDLHRRAVQTGLPMAPGRLLKRLASILHSATPGYWVEGGLALQGFAWACGNVLDAQLAREGWAADVPGGALLAISLGTVLALDDFQTRAPNLELVSTKGHAATYVSCDGLAVRVERRPRPPAAMWLPVLTDVGCIPALHVHPSQWLSHERVIGAVTCAIQARQARAAQLLAGIHGPAGTSAPRAAGATTARRLHAIVKTRPRPVTPTPAAQSTWLSVLGAAAQTAP